MKKTIFLPLFVGFCILVLLMSNTHKITSTGAPIGSTGAPGESTCAKSGCHTGNNNVNTGTGKLSIDIPSLNGGYIPGKTYMVTVTMHQENIKRFGFSFSAFNEKSQSKAGNLITTDENRTQILAGAAQYENREYMTYKAIGTNPFSENNGQWSFEWQAPEKAGEDISFYIASVAANNDGTDEGDEVYTQSFSLKNYTGSVQNITEANPISVYPNPVEKNLVFSFLNKENCPTKISIYNINGSKTFGLYNGELAIGEQSFSFAKPKEVASGIYFLSIEQNQHTFIKKIIIN